ncbi:MAG: hypothetical protein KDA24_19055 [Deltaproteobacteria bacterium]|nr:hypothetical protein [Deltaproteobacteria bacterium]
MRRLPAVACAATAALLMGCYDRLAPPVPPGETPVTETSPPEERPVRPSVAGTGQLAKNLDALDGVITRLGVGSGTRSAADRPGSARWRPAELEKLTELMTAICAPGAAGCRQGLERLVAAELPSDELRGVLAIFMGPLRPLAETGFATLGAHLLVSPDAEVRDLTFRMAVAAGATRRGEADDVGRRATLMPQSPLPGSRVVVVVELPSPCPKVRTEFKGPDINGRLDVDVQPACDGVPPPEPSADGFPVPARAVWALPLESLPTTGVSVWAYSASAPLLDYTPRGPETGKDEVKEPQ